jgi:hypothetical protein
VSVGFACLQVNTASAHYCRPFTSVMTSFAPAFLTVVSHFATSFPTFGSPRFELPPISAVGRQGISLALWLMIASSLRYERANANPDTVLPSSPIARGQD